MTSLSQRGFTVFRVTLAAAVLWATVPVLVAALGGQRWHVALLAGIETLGAVLFLVPRQVRLGAVLLLVAFGFAIVAHALRGELHPHLLVYAAGAAYVLLHERARA